MYECFHCGARAVIWDADFDSEDYGYEPGGIVHVYVNGTPVLENGEFIGGRAGEVILKER
jgi:hypothetical protein